MKTKILVGVIALPALVNLGLCLRLFTPLGFYTRYEKQADFDRGKFERIRAFENDVFERQDGGSSSGFGDLWAPGTFSASACRAGQIRQTKEPGKRQALVELARSLNKLAQSLDFQLVPHGFEGGSFLQDESVSSEPLEIRYHIKKALLHFGGSHGRDSWRSLRNR